MAHFATQHSTDPVSQSQYNGTPTTTQQQQQQDTPSTELSTINSYSNDMTGDQSHSNPASSFSGRSVSLKSGGDGVSTTEEKTESGDAAPRPSSTMNGIKMSSKSDNQRPSRPSKLRSRSTSSSVLARFNSRGSSTQIQDAIGGEPVSPTSTKDSLDSPTKPKIDRAALTKPRGKYKSGINFTSSPMNLAAGDEPFMEQASPHERTEEEIAFSMKMAEIEQMAATGSTKAALARAQSNSIGDPIFATHRRAMAEASAKAAQAQAQAAAAAAAAASSSSLLSSRVKTMPSTSPRLPMEGSRPSNLRFSAGEMNGISEDSSRGESLEDSQGGDDQNLVSEAAEHVLASAKRAARLSTDALNMMMGEEQQEESQTSTNEVENAKQSRRRTFLGFGGGTKEKKEKKEKKKKGKSKGDKMMNSDEVTDTTGEGELEKAETTMESDQQGEQTKSTLSKSQDSKDTTGTMGRKRRFNDTRQLNMLASELAVEALMGAPENYPTLTPETRRASMMSLLAATNGEFGASPSNTSQISLQQGGGSGAYSSLTMPNPAFASEYGRSGSPVASSSRSGSPRHGANDLPRFEGPRAPFGRSQHSLSTPSSPLMTQKTKLNGVPSDMLAGLGDGPYPALPPRGMDYTDPFGIPMANEGPYDFAPQGRNSLPGSFNRSRGTSASSSMMPKRSVLQMSMYNPEAEMQGLTKLPKSGKSTPFGSRAPSRQVTPSPSFTGLRERANASVPASIAPVKSTSPEGSMLRNVSPEDASIGTDQEAGVQSIDGEREGKVEKGKEEKVETGSKKKERPAQKTSRRSFFGKKTKQSVDSEEKAPKADLLEIPPLPGKAVAPSQSTSSDSQPSSRPNSNISNGTRSLANDSRSGQNLFKVPSPTNTNTTTSASSHEPGAFAYSSDGGSQRQGLSTVTTPEAMPIKAEPILPTPPSLTPPSLDRQLPRPQSSSPSKLGSSTPTSATSPTTLNGNSSVSKAGARNFSASTKASDNTSVVKKKNKLKSFFSSKSGNNSPVMKASDVPPELPFYKLDIGRLADSPSSSEQASSERLDSGPAGGNAGGQNNSLKKKNSQQPSTHGSGTLNQAYMNPTLQQAGFGTRSAFQSYTPIHTASR